MFIGGEQLSEEEKERLYEDAETYGFTRERIVLRENASLRRENVSEVMKEVYEHNAKQISALNDTIASLRSSLNRYLPVEAVSK